MGGMVSLLSRGSKSTFYSSTMVWRAFMLLHSGYCQSENFSHKLGDSVFFIFLKKCLPSQQGMCPQGDKPIYPQRVNVASQPFTTWERGRQFPSHKITQCLRAQFYQVLGFVLISNSNSSDFDSRDINYIFFDFFFVCLFVCLFHVSNTITWKLLVTQANLSCVFNIVPYVWLGNCC